MEVTLSQATLRSNRSLRRRFLIERLPACGLLILFGFVLGCNRIGSGIDSAVETEVASLDPETNAPSNFVWPSDPSHPTLSLELEIEGQPGHRIAIELMPELAPVTVAQIIALAKNGYYDGTTFHRVIPGFMIQGGDPFSRDRDPNNDGLGGSDLAIDDEFGHAPFLRGVVGMSNQGSPNSTGSQFFIMHADGGRSLDGRYTVIGRVVSGIEIVDAITQVSIDRVGRWGPRDRPIKGVRMTRVSIEERAAELAKQSTP